MESNATRTYREIWKGLESLSTVHESVFVEPKLLYIRLPAFNVSSDTSAYGVVELLLTVSYRGAATGQISQIVDPPNTDIEFRTKLAARETRIRPAKKDGKPLTSPEYLVKHHYPLLKRDP